MMPISIADEIEKITRGRMHGRFQRRFPRVPNRSRWQTSMDVGVIRRLELHVLMMQSTAVISLQLLGIDDAGIGLQRYFFCQAIVINAGHYSALLGNSGFLFHD